MAKCNQLTPLTFKGLTEQQAKVIWREVASTPGKLFAFLWGISIAI